MGDAFGGAESGTQLLARLEGRSSLKNLEPCLFAEEGSPVHDLRYHPVSSPLSHLRCPELLQLSLPGRKHILEDKCSPVETYLQLCFCWRVMDRGRRNTTLMAAI
ncbi:DNA repair protein XRCC2 isoform X3 [Vidua macroura]|uniref:DNA repair protein XRCC2 isoform X3 n=1 Tax=Vidua macroura TaxID=187451 RepID=UPI0023A8C3BC|nr:DNA repair protein XRCC2 isoform X3 [Vidua macroura]